MYLYQAMDSDGNTLDFLLNATRSGPAAKCFYQEGAGGRHITTPSVINVDKNPSYSGAVRDLKQ